jgi:hypothetical protein
MGFSMFGTGPSLDLSLKKDEYFQLIELIVFFITLP